MASFTVGGQAWPDGTVVSVYLASALPSSATSPSGPVLASGTVSGGSVTFSGLSTEIRYVAWAGGVARWFLVPPLNPMDPRSLRTRVDELTEGGSGGDTADTFEAYKTIMLSDGTVKAIPAGADAPAMPTALSRSVALSAVSLTWQQAARAASYRVYRDGVLLATSASASYRDLAVVGGQTYTYTVQAVDQYGQRSAITSPVSAFINPALNVAPTVEVKSWPATFSSPGKTLIRVNAKDVDGQQLAHALGITAGTATLTATEDPTVWEVTVPWVFTDPGDGTLSLPRVAWEGGPAYYTTAQSGAKMTKAQASGWNSASFFPVATWRSDAQDADSLSAVGINVMLGPNVGTGSVADMTSNGMTMIPMWGEWETEATTEDKFVGWMASDEPELAGIWAHASDWLTDVAAQRAFDPNRFIHTNFAHGVLQTFWWQGTGEMESAVQGTDIASLDQYFYTSPGIRHNVVDPYSTSPLVARDWPGPWADGNYAQRAGSYGWTMQRLRTLSAGSNRPFWFFVETQMPLLTETGREIILYAKIRGAVWAALCNEARGICYFQHNGDYGAGAPTTDPNTGIAPNGTVYSLVNGDAALRAYVAAINAQVHALAPVLNTQSYVWNFGATGITTMLKASAGFAYIFTSVALGGTTGFKTFTLPPEVTGTSVEVVDESRSIGVSGGAFTDTFAAEYSHHIYKVAIR